MTRTDVRPKGRTRSRYSCRECGAQSARWLGRCAECGEWNTIDEEPDLSGAPAAVEALGPGSVRAVPIASVEAVGASGLSTGEPELDRVLGGGIVTGSVTLLGGEPGMGKSTLLLQALGHLAADGARCLLVSAEEASAQVALRAQRLGALADGLLVVSETSLPRVAAHVADVAPDVLAIDSIQAVMDPDLPGVAGSVSQVRQCAQALVGMAKERAMATVLVGHVTKDGALAGPRALEHIVDTVLSFDGDRHHSLRMLHALKHRFGPTSELGVFEMTEAGLAAVSDPSRLFLADRRTGLPGSVVVPVMEGARPLLVEVQALVVATGASTPRRAAQGIESSRMHLLLAVLDARGKVGLRSADVFASVAGGVRVDDTGSDLGVALAVASSRRSIPLPPDLVALGEVGLGGEVRQASHMSRRLAEAARLGFRRAIVPDSTPEVDGIHLDRVRDIAEALTVAGLGPVDDTDRAAPSWAGPVCDEPWDESPMRLLS